MGSSQHPVRYGHEHRNSKHPQSIKADHHHGQASLRCRNVRDYVVDLFAGSGGLFLAIPSLIYGRSSMTSSESLVGKAAAFYRENNESFYGDTPKVGITTRQFEKLLALIDKPQ